MSCACGSGVAYAACCGPFIDGNAVAPTAEALMRSRYVGYTLRREEYLLATWHVSKRPPLLGLQADGHTKWLGLQVKRHVADGENASVEFVARFKVGGYRAERLHEVSRFVRENGQWFYVDGETNNEGANARKILRT